MAFIRLARLCSVAASSPYPAPSPLNSTTPPPNVPCDGPLYFLRRPAVRQLQIQDGEAPFATHQANVQWFYERRERLPRHTMHKHALMSGACVHMVANGCHAAFASRVRLQKDIARATNCARARTRHGPDGGFWCRLRPVFQNTLALSSEHFDEDCGFDRRCVFDMDRSACITKRLR